MNISQELTNYYCTHNEDARLRSRHGQVEFLTTVHYIEKYLERGMNILEIGAGSGIYSHYFARNGYCVDAVELINHNVEVFKQNTLENETVTITQGNALNLSHIPDNTYDITLLLGPMYHLYTEGEQLQALSEAMRVTKPKGIVFAAYCNSDMVMYQTCFARNMLYPQAEKQKIDMKSFRLFSQPEDVFQLYRKEDIDALMSHFHITRMHYVGTDMLTRFVKDTVDKMDDKTFDIYMRYHFVICERADMVGTSNHMLDIFRKEVY